MASRASTPPPTDPAITPVEDPLDAPAIGGQDCVGLWGRAASVIDAVFVSVDEIDIDDPVRDGPDAVAAEAGGVAGGEIWAAVSSDADRDGAEDGDARDVVELGTDELRTAGRVVVRLLLLVAMMADIDVLDGVLGSGSVAVIGLPPGLFAAGQPRFGAQGSREQQPRKPLAQT
ncbi:hypothetical protein ANO11243_021770 [Dothideomycetidae sp. 11243]|nr:hypothetical protein ANO11243_021770 [fungal sp. No.11243]